MTRDKARRDLPKTTTRERVLDAAERLLGHGAGAFSMRDLAEEAGVSFATPFNQFGSKAAIMLALSARRIDAMRDQLAHTTLQGSAVARVLAAVDIATAVMLSAPAVNRAVMGAISAPSEEAGSLSTHSSLFWSEALGDDAGTLPFAKEALPDLLAIAFRGVLSFWTAGELTDEALIHRARAAAAAVLLGFAGTEDRAALLVLLTPPSSVT